MPSKSVRRAIPVLAAALAVAGTLFFAASSASASTTTVSARPAAPAVAADLTATIKLNNCSASLVRFPTSRAGDRSGCGVRTRLPPRARETALNTGLGRRL